MVSQKKGIPFILTSVIIWALISIVASLDLNIGLKNILVFTCSAPLLPISWLIGKKMGVNIFSKDNPLGDLGFIFTLNQILYLLIVMWVFNAVPEKMIMVYAMVYGAHLLPYSWLYKSKSYMVFSLLITILALIIGNMFGGLAVSISLCLISIIFSFSLWREVKSL